MFPRKENIVRRVLSRSGWQAGQYPLVGALEPRVLFSATIYVSDNSNQLFTADTSTGQTALIGNMGVTMLDIAENPQGQLFGVDGSSNLYSINSTTAAATEIGALGTGVNSLAFSSNGTLYGANDSLYTINPSTGAAAMIGSLGGGIGSGGDLAFDVQGNLFLGTSSNDLAKVNTTTGQATDLGSTGFSEVYGLALGSDGVMYGVSGATGQIFSMNLTTGSGTAVSTLSGGVASVFGAASLPILPLSDATSLAASARPLNTGSDVTFTATVTPATTGATTPTGTVSFLDNGVVIGSAALQSNGAAVFSTTSLPTGTNAITASYSGDLLFFSSASTSLTETVTPLSSVMPRPNITNLPHKVFAGGKPNRMVSVRLTNHGPKLKGSYLVQLYADTSTNFDGNQVLLTMKTKKYSIGHAGHRRVHLTVKTLPSTLPQGTYYVLAEVTDPTGATQVTPSTRTIDVSVRSPA
jgi:hypothetical protein